MIRTCLWSYHIDNIELCVESTKDHHYSAHFAQDILHRNTFQKGHSVDYLAACRWQEDLPRVCYVLDQTGVNVQEIVGIHRIVPGFFS